jgi:serine/threonine-protein kinase
MSEGARLRHFPVQASSSKARSPEPGDIVAGKYVVEHAIGRGGMGAVYVVAHRFTGKRLALKCLLPEHMESQETVERFVRESQAAGRVQHRHVTDIFDVGRDGDVLYMVMPLLSGQTLTQIMNDRSLGTRELLIVIIRAMEGVAAAHAQGVVHRDLKPDNIFVCVGPSGRLDDPRVLDFGISKLQDDPSDRLTRSGVTLGTPYYMSFEQISGQRDLDLRVDVYAMGVILYEALYGERPYFAETVGGLAIRMLSPAPHLRDLMPELPEELANVVMRAIERERGLRFPTMGAFVDALRPLVGDDSHNTVPDLVVRRSRPSLRTDFLPTLSSREDHILPTQRMSNSATVPLPRLPTLADPETLVNTRLMPSLKPSSRTGFAVGVIVLVVLGAVGAWWVQGERTASMPNPRASEEPDNTPAGAHEPAQEPPGRPLAAPTAPAERTVMGVQTAEPAPEPARAENAPDDAAAAALAASSAEAEKRDARRERRQARKRENESAAAGKVAPKDAPSVGDEPKSQAVEPDPNVPVEPAEPLPSAPPEGAAKPADAAAKPHEGVKPVEEEAPPEKEQTAAPAAEAPDVSGDAPSTPAP